MKDAILAEVDGEDEDEEEEEEEEETADTPLPSPPSSSDEIFKSLPMTVQKYFTNDLGTSSLTPIQTATLSRVIDSERIKMAPPFVIHSGAKLHRL